jgi:hypothetical protein
MIVKQEDFDTKEVTGLKSYGPFQDSMSILKVAKSSIMK